MSVRGTRCREGEISAPFHPSQNSDTVLILETSERFCSESSLARGSSDGPSSAGLASAARPRTVAGRGTYVKIKSLGGVNMWKLNQTLSGSFSAVSKPNFASKYSLESSWRDLQDLHAFAPLRPQYFSNFSSKFFGVFEIRHAEKFNFCQISSWFSLIFMKFHRIFSDFLEKRCNYSKYLDFNFILAWLYRRFI